MQAAAKTAKQELKSQLSTLRSGVSATKRQNVKRAKAMRKAWALLRPASDQLGRCLALLPPSLPSQALPGKHEQGIAGGPLSPSRTNRAQQKAFATQRRRFGKGTLCSLPFRLLTTCYWNHTALAGYCRTVQSRDSCDFAASAGSRRFMGFASSGPSGRRLVKAHDG